MIIIYSIKILIFLNLTKIYPIDFNQDGLIDIMLGKCNQYVTKLGYFQNMGDGGEQNNYRFSSDECVNVYILFILHNTTN